jgi:hypothetical protein
MNTTSHRISNHTTYHHHPTPPLPPTPPMSNSSLIQLILHHRKNSIKTLPIKFPSPHIDIFFLLLHDFFVFDDFHFPPETGCFVDRVFEVSGELVETFDCGLEDRRGHAAVVCRADAKTSISGVRGKGKRVVEDGEVGRDTVDRRRRRSIMHGGYRHSTSFF